MLVEMYVQSLRTTDASEELDICLNPCLLDGRFTRNYGAYPHAIFVENGILQACLTCCVSPGEKEKRMTKAVSRDSSALPHFS